MSVSGIIRSLSVSPTSLHTYVDRVLLQPGTVLTGDNRYYSVFSPFKRRWLSIYQERATGPFDVDGRSRESVKPSTDPICNRQTRPLSFSTTEADAQRHLMNSSPSGLKTTKQPEQPLGTRNQSFVGALARGLLSPRQCVRAAEHALNLPIWEFPNHAFSWINELIWRDFINTFIGFRSFQK